MDSVRITVTLARSEIQTLIQIAEKERRHPREQARYFLRASLENYIQETKEPNPINSKPKRSIAP